MGKYQTWHMYTTKYMYVYIYTNLKMHIETIFPHSLGPSQLACCFSDKTKGSYLLNSSNVSCTLVKKRKISF